ncbi:hypothetical protein KQI89_07815 [Clostridium sp. MSJ-4]|uniref:Gram-positive cocci surface proteins LPxTG domain-containing protein n=1 Tax=Clostridium simiarum TaxID=2841506 RepID=A0ABS6EZW5_9CLOT|nr:SpaA isopeptide-forming pilin-related protein [Clostridium simiarum]MBU5591670.1 hypothetical protein [Clostridium simiarum]
MRKKRYNIKQKKKLSIFTAFIAVILQIFSIIPAVQVRSADVTSTFPFITEVTLTDSKGNPINESSNPISKNAEVKLTYKFSILNQGTVKNGDTYTMQIPKEIQIINTLNFPITLDNGDTIAKVTIGTDGKVNITFNEFAESNSNVSGYFYIDTQFDPNQIGGTDPVPIKFEVGGNSSPIVINVNFKQPEIPKASVMKEGSYDASKNEITWKVIVNPENVKVNNAQIVDNISLGQEFIPDSVKINGANADTANYSYDGISNKLTYNFSDVIEKQQIITFKTKVVNPKAFENEGATVYEYNKAIFNHDGTTVDSNEASVEIITDFIRKDGKYDEKTKRINWTIYVNNNAQSIPNAVVTDDIPEGLTFTLDSVKIDGNSTKDNYTINGEKFIYTFPMAINEPHKIEFSTDVTDEGAFNSNTSKNYNNKVTLIGDGVPSNASDNKGVGVPTSIIYKYGKEYNAATGEITWQVVVNHNKIAIKNAVVTDEIRLGQEYVEGSATIDKSYPGGSFNYDKVVSDKEKTGTLTYTFSGDISETYVITFKTKVTDPNVFAGNRNENYYNVVKLTGDNIVQSQGQGEQKVQSQVIDKSSKDYNYVTREITWKVVVNKNKMLLTNAYFTDAINEGQEFVPNSVMLNGNAAEATNYKYDETTKILTYSFPSEIKDEQIITFKTKITDTSIFNTNGEKVFNNTAKLITDLVPGGVESKGTGKIKSTLIDKKADYTKGNSYIDWNVTINANEILIKDAVLTDTLQEGLELDTTSIKLYKQTLNPDGTLLKGEEITLDQDNVKYNTATREFTFTLPSTIEEAYILAFRTDVVDKKKSPFTNSISFKGTGLIQSSSSSKVDVIFQGAGGGGVGETGSIKVVKVNSNNEDIKLEGAVFELLDKYQNVIRTSELTGVNGEVVFDKLKFDIDYYVREKEAPTGYVLSNELYKFQLKNSQDEKNIVYNYKNRSITGEIEFFKNGDNDNPLEGAEFAIYKLSDTAYENPLATSISDKDGKVQFKNVEYGEYSIKETKAPEGYNLSDEILKASITEDGEVVKANPYSISNTRIKGNIEFIKLGEEREPLQGAEFKLYKEADTSYKKPVATAISDKSGHVEFKNIEYGKYNIKETKAPKGYVLSKEVLTANITKSGITVKANPESISNKRIRENKIIGNIEFIKLGEEREPLQGAEFKLYKETDTNFESPIATAISDESGRVEFKNIEYGRYNIKETKAPEGYVISKEVLTANIIENGITVKANPESISNTRIKGNIEFTKLGEDKEPLQGAEFKLYKETDTNFENPIAIAISDESGRVEFKNIEYGKYNIKETKAPEGYVLSYEVLTANITKSGITVKANPESISNIRIKGNIEFIKLGEEKEPLQGAEFKLYKETDTNFEKPIAAAISDESGRVEFKNIEYGKYIIKETKAPEGYVLSDEVLTANIIENDITVKSNPESISNRKIRGSVQVKKLDENKEPLKGAEFTLYNAEGKEIKTSVSREDGTLLFEDLVYGEYTIKETKVPEGYLASEGTIKVFVDKDRELYTYEVVNNRIKGVIVITKTDMNGKILQGAEFTLYDRDGKEVTTVVSDNNGVVIFNDVDYSSYTIKETKAPKGYILGKEELEVKVNSPETQRFTVKNQAEKLADKIINLLPKTGNLFGSTVIIIIGALTILSGVGLFLKRNR